ncbi:type II secretion system F family protein [Halalkalicoccus jeotgali]|uniref:Type IV pilus biogenesis complex membrane subunit n=1 Tax=Halalkalicoccus jeotgali (strain DSM 18796 / CECT 7217 / JCM 14584 / KCTC 4019 / B3) TaxID=795797 RepID=D8J4V1_HALJB|nr:type II secretion system F family protein [Halalkalicoccus jeotgali]ADJ15568.1 type IV pilus biogenesis complex membrane subunit [Halalkalicoccus jeotgali B3]ELY36024.1 type IV pilus biogenesis complex membrane subunit [Halalkalicoccus jeotgali B3]
MSLALGEGGTDRLGDAFYPLYRRLFGEDSQFAAEFQTTLKRARMGDTVEHYLSRALAYGVLSGGLLWIVGIAAGYGLFATGLVSPPIIGVSIPNDRLLELVIAARIPSLVLITGVTFGSAGFALAFGALVAIPYSRVSARKREIDMLLADSIAFMYALSVGGLNQLEILEAIANADDTYGEVSREFQSIVHETEYFDTDYRSAIRTQARETPSEELSQFLTDMLSIVDSGGDMTRFFEDKKDKHMRTAKQQEELTLETLELFGEMYMTLSLFPLLLIILLVIMSMLGEASEFMLYATVYALIPLVGAGFLVLVSTVKQDEPGDGYLGADDETADSTGRNPLFDLGLIHRYAGRFGMFDRIERREGSYETGRLLRYPHRFFRDHPTYTLALTIPAALALLITAVVSGAAPLSWSGFVAAPVGATVLWVYVPVYVVCVPLAVFREWNVHSRTAITGSLSDTLRKLSSANETGMTLLESIRVVAETSSGPLAREFEVIHAKVAYGTSLKDSLTEFNNEYHIPRLARTVKLISKAQEASSQITAVLTTAAQASENRDEIERERRSRTRMQVVIILMTYLTLLAVMAILKTQFLDVMAGLDTGGAEATSVGGGPSFGGGIDTGLLSVLFFHAVTMQAILSGLISGYIRDAAILSGVKYVVVLLTIALAVWAVVG